MNALAGHLKLKAGVAPPHNLSSTRRAWAAQISPGRTVVELPALLAGLYSLCGHAHRIVCQLAIQVAEPSIAMPAMDVARVLQRETALEHIRRITLDWPRLLRPVCVVRDVKFNPELALQACPLRACPDVQVNGLDMQKWLLENLLQMSPVTWLEAWSSGGVNWLEQWGREYSTGLPAMFHAMREVDMDLPHVQSRTFKPYAHPESLLDLGQALCASPSFALQPLWQGLPACTGPWTRKNQSDSWPTWTSRSLMGSRLAELIRLCLPDVPDQTGAGWLSWGAVSMGPHKGLAWVEMARGVLIHQVTLEEPNSIQAVSERRRVRACQVLAPTEWNFHPLGIVAQALSQLRPAEPDGQARLQLLMAAIDPCVPFDLVGPEGSIRAVEFADA